MGKRPKAAHQIAAKKTPRVAPGVERGAPAWNVGRLDFGGPWCPKTLSGQQLIEVMEKLRGFESMSWPAILAAGSHCIPVSDLPTPARRRLMEIQLDDLDNLLSLRIKAKSRLWGFRQGDVFSALWWDPNHQVYPVEKWYT